MRNRNHLVTLIILVALMLLFLPLVCAGQRNTAYLSMPLPERGLGVGYERTFYNEPKTTYLGAYIGMTAGKYHIWYQRGLKHIKIAGGLTYYVHTPGSRYINIFIAGLNYNFYNRMDEIKNSVYFPVSFDVGTGVKIKRIGILMTYDILKKDAGLNFRYSFNVIKP
jgi:hypothetical protein